MHSVSPLVQGMSLRRPVADYLSHRLDAPPASRGQHCATMNPRPAVCSQTHPLFAVGAYTKMFNGNKNVEQGTQIP
jgi:hypothetical protein